MCSALRRYLERYDLGKEEYALKSKLFQGSGLYYPAASVLNLTSDSTQLNNADLDSLLRCDFINEYKNIWLIGPPGTGKTYISNVIGKYACKLQYSARYFEMHDLFIRCEAAERANVFPLFSETLCKTNLIILDDFLLTGISNRQALYLISLLNHSRDPENPRTLLICSSLTLEQIKHRLLEVSPKLGETIMSKLTAEMIVLTIKGNDLRKKRLKPGH